MIVVRTEEYSGENLMLDFEVGGHMQHQDYDRRLGYYTLLRLAENTFVQLCKSSL